jgi:hypothetical protein
MNRAIAIAAACVAAIGCAIGGYAIGSSSATTEEDAVSAREDARAEAFAKAKASAYAEARARGHVAGQTAGRRSGELAGTNAGNAEGAGSASAELAAAEAAERAENCGAPLFVTGYCPTDEEIARENQAEALCGPGTEAGREQAAAMGIDCGIPGQ